MQLPVRKILQVVLLGVLFYAGYVLFSGYRQLATGMATFHASAFLLALGLASANYLIRFVKWEFYLRWLGITSVGRLDSLLIFLSGFVLTVTPGKIGEVFKCAVLARTHGIALERTAPIVVVERLTDVIAIVILLLWGSTTFEGGLLWAGLGAGAVGLGLAMIAWSTPAFALFDSLDGTRLAPAVPKLRRSYEELRRLAVPRALLVPTLLSLGAWGLEGIALWVLLRGFECNVHPAQATFFYATATLAGALVPVPGGLGVTETIIQQQLVRLGGVATGIATASMLLIRLATLWWAVLVGFVALLILRARYPRELSDTAPEARSADRAA